MEAIKIHNAVALGSWEEVDNLPLSTITKNDSDTAKLDGLIIKGYETKFSNTNENGERYEKECLDEFIQTYFVDNKLNMPVDVQHRSDIDHLCGRVLIVETNSVGFYFVAYVPKTYCKYEELKNLIKEGIIQGFSKEGWATDYDFIYKKDGTFDYMLIKKMRILSVSLVSTPANANAFEKAQEIKNATILRKQNKKKSMFK